MLAPAKLAVACDAVSKYGNDTVIVSRDSILVTHYLKKATERNTKRLTLLKRNFVKDSDKDIEQEIDAQSSGAGGHGHCLGRKSRGQNCTHMGAGLVWKPRLRV
jgi:hypothetical protein